MENDLHQAFYGVFCSSKEIIKNNQRHLYVNMLDLLGRTCRATGLAESKIGADNLVKFWLEDILPLVFDNDKMIQSCAVSTMEQGLSLIEISTIHNCKLWPQLRTSIVSSLPDRIHELRVNKNKHWHQIWCLIISILDREILNGASVINSFLSTVELGFRSSDCNVRAETFTCWRLLIKIFHAYNELLTPKRLKLICIPLKSTQSKSASLANIKIRVWWYLITCISEKLGEHFSKVVEPFLTYVFGSPNRELSGDVQQYENIQILAVLCLAQILLDEQDEFIDILITENDLGTLIRPSPLLNLEILKENWKPLTHAIINAVTLFSNDEDESDNRDAKQHLRNWLVLRLVKIMLHLNYAPCTQEVCRSVMKFLPTQTIPLTTALNCIASNGIKVDDSLCDIENYSDVLSSVLSLLIAGKPFITAGVFQRCIEQISKTPQLFEREQIQQQALCAIIKIVCSSKDDDDFEAFETKLLCWKRVAQTIINHLSDKNLSYRRKDFAEVINGFILWPLHHFASFTGRCQTICFNDDFCALWRQLLLCGQNAPNRENFLEDVQKVLRDLATTGQKELPLSELVNAYVAAMLKLDSGKNISYIKDILIFLRDLIEQPNIVATKSFEVYLNTLRNVFLHMKNQELTENFELVKTSIGHVVNIVAKEKPTNTKVFTDWKQGILERFRSLPQKNFSTQIRETFKNDDVFVIIPNVWMLNPDKLTERQKERFAERSDIPALYNDMSQSQDSAIKPWTPNKVVIAKKDKTEIVIGSSQVDEEENNGSSKNANSGANNIVEMRCTRGRTSKVADVSNENSIKSKNFKLSTNASGNENEDIKPIIKSSTEAISTELTTTIRTRKSLRSKMEDAEQKVSEIAARGVANKSPVKSKQSEINQKKSLDSNECVADKPNPTSTSVSATRKRVASQDTQLNTETQTYLTDKITPTDETIPETPAQTITAIPDENVVNVESNLPADPIEMNLEPKETSPKKSSTKIMGLSSPPDRKSTNNSCSPSLRPKPTPHLTRGAQLINMIRSKMKVDSPAASSVMFGSSRSSILLHKSDKRESTPVPEAVLEPGGFENTSTPLQKKDLLTFTKRLPSPSASPSASILKRKLRRDSLDDIAIDSPATKRKRVSFHDPPVSLTKEYVRDVEENAKPKRCLALDKITAGQAAEIKHALKRRSKLESMVEIEGFANEPIEKHYTDGPSTSSATKMSLNFEEQNNIQTDSEVCLSSNSTNTEAHIESLPDVDTALKIVIAECPLETILERYFCAEKTASTKEADTLAKFVSKCMTTNPKVKSSVLEVLSENHSKDFLDHAVQENLSSVVCDRLNLDSVIDYICAKSKLNTSCRNNLLTKIPDVLKHSKVEKEPLNFVGTLIESLNPNDTTMLDLIAGIMRIRQERQNCLTPDLDSTDVSSSNL